MTTCCLVKAFVQRRALNVLVEDVEWGIGHVRIKNVCKHHMNLTEIDGRWAEVKAPIVTLGDMIQLTEPEFLRMPNFGKISLGYVKAGLARYGLKLKPWP